MNLKTINPLSLLFFVLSFWICRHTSICAPINVLIITDDGQINQLTDGLAPYPDFGAITVIPWTDPPLAVTMQKRMRETTDGHGWTRIKAGGSRFSFERELITKW